MAFFDRSKSFGLGVDADSVGLAREGISVGIAELVTALGLQTSDAACFHRGDDKLRLFEPSGCAFDTDTFAVSRVWSRLISSPIFRLDRI